MKFEYCGGWGYRRHCVAAIGEIEKKQPGVFKYYLYPDKGVTGRLEVTLYLNSTDASGEGILLHSKQASKKYIHQDYETFLALLEDALPKEWVLRRASLPSDLSRQESLIIGRRSASNQLDTTPDDWLYRRDLITEEAGGDLSIRTKVKTAFQS